MCAAMLNPSTLAAYLLPAMLAWIPPSSHTRETEVETVDRYERIAYAVASVTLEEGAPRPLGTVETALLLASIAAYESSFTDRVATCRQLGDHGHAAGLWQSHTEHAVVCASLEGAARVALHHVAVSFGSCRSLEVGDRLSVYTDGHCLESWRRSRVRVNRALAWFARHPF